jgi:general stress protein 26
MTQLQFLIEIEALIENSKSAVLATADQEGQPWMRWMTPALLKDRPGALYAVTSPDFVKCAQLDQNPQVQWMVQSRALDRIAHMNGKVNVIESASMKTEVLEEIGGKLGVFWKLNSDAEKLVVLETIIEEGRIFLPMKGETKTVLFG